MDRLDIDKKRAIELGIQYVDKNWKSVIEDEVELSVLRYTIHSRQLNLFNLLLFN